MVADRRCVSDDPCRGGVGGDDPFARGGADLVAGRSDFCGHAIYDGAGRTALVGGDYADWRQLVDLGLVVGGGLLFFIKAQYLIV